MLEALSSFVVSFLVSFLRGWLSDLRGAAAQREAGAASAREAGRRDEDAALERAREAANAAEARHKGDPSDGAFRNTDFRD